MSGQSYRPETHGVSSITRTDSTSVPSETMNRILNNAGATTGDFRELFVQTLDGRIVASTNSELVGTVHDNEKFFVLGLNDDPVSLFYHDDLGQLRMYLAGPLFQGSRRLSVLLIDSEVSTIVASSTDYLGLGETGETLLVHRSDEGHAGFLTPTRFAAGETSIRMISKEDLDSPFTQALQKRRNFSPRRSIIVVTPLSRLHAISTRPIGVSWYRCASPRPMRRLSGYVHGCCCGLVYLHSPLLRLHCLSPVPSPVSLGPIDTKDGLLIEDAPNTSRLLKELKQMGVRLSLDDFGRGYSSLSHLKRFPFDALKIDRAFISGITQGNEDSAPCKAITAMANELNLSVVAEGVETEQQWAFLRSHGIDLVQGLLYQQAVG